MEKGDMEPNSDGKESNGEEMEATRGTSTTLETVAGVNSSRLLRDPPFIYFDIGYV